MRLSTAVLYLLLIHLCFSQTLKQTIIHFGLLGTKQIGTHVILLSKSERNEVKLTSINEDGSTLWENTLAIAALSGYHFNKVQLLGNDSLIFLILHNCYNQARRYKWSNSEMYKLKTGENVKVQAYRGRFLLRRQTTRCKLGRQRPRRTPKTAL